MRGTVKSRVSNSPWPADATKAAPMDLAVDTGHPAEAVRETPGKCYNDSQLHHAVNFAAPGHPTLGTTVEACGAACCADPERCTGFTFTSHQPHGSGPCKTGEPCCWIKTGAGRLVPGNCGAHPGSGNCTSVVLRELPPPPPPQPSKSVLRPRVRQLDECHSHSALGNTGTGRRCLPMSRRLRSNRAAT